MSVPHEKLTGVKEDSNFTITGVFKDGDGNALGSGDLTTVAMWLTDKADGTTINSRSNTDILNAGPGTVDGSGNFTLVLAPEDNPFNGNGITDAAEEIHILTIEWTWNSGANKAHMEIWLYVDNSTDVPTA